MKKSQDGRLSGGAFSKKYIGSNHNQSVSSSAVSKNQVMSAATSAQAPMSPISNQIHQNYDELVPDDDGDDEVTQLEAQINALNQEVNIIR